jgi:hypothetical protein
MRAGRRSSWLVGASSVLACLAAACGSSGSAAPQDGGSSSTHDGGGGAKPDAHATSGDARADAKGHQDAGKGTGRDSGAPGTDSGSPTKDSGTPPPPYAGVVQRGNDLARDAVFVDPAFTKAVISQAGSLKQDTTFTSPAWTGPVFAAPLYYVDANLGKDLVVVVTDDNEVYALDAATGATVWSLSPLVKPLTSVSKMACKGSVGPPLGITGTPVIDPATGTLYLNAITMNAAKPEHQIFALDLDTGTTRAGWPVQTNSVTTVLTDGTTFAFVSSDENQRGALTFVNGTLYVPYGGIDGDCGNYHGWVIAVDTTMPTKVTAYATDAHQAGIWAPSGVASDGTNVYIATGNGDTGQETGSWLGGEAVIKLGPGATFDPTNKASFFYPNDYVNLDEGDDDLGSTGPVLFDFDDPMTGTRHLVWEIGKTDNAILLDRDNLGGEEGELSAPMVSNGWLFGSLAAYHSTTATYTVFNGGASCGGDTIAMKINPSTASTPITATVGWCGTLGGNGEAPIISTTDGTTDAVVWGLGNGLTALDGDTGVQLAQVSVPGSTQHWVTPIIAKGRIFVAGDTGAWAFLP